MSLLSKFIGLFRRAKTTQQTEATNMENTAQPAAAAFAGIAPAAPAAIPEAVAVEAAAAAGTVTATTAPAPAVVTSNAPARLSLGIRLAARFSTLVPAATESQVEAAASAALDVLMPAI